MGNWRVSFGQTVARFGLTLSPRLSVTSPVGNGSSHSLSAGEWAHGFRSFRFSVTIPANYTDIRVYYDLARNQTGPAFNHLYYSLDGGGSFTGAATGMPVSLNTWNSTTGQSSFSFNKELGDLNLTASPLTVIFSVTGQSTDPAATLQIDNFIVSNGAYSMSAIPEPSTYAAIVGACALIGAAIWRRKRPN